MRILIILIEVIDRELIEKLLFIKVALKKFKKLKIYLSQGHEILKNNSEFKDCIVFDKSLSITKKKIHSSILKKNQLVVFDVESPISNWDKETRKARLPKNILKQIDAFFVQNSLDKKILKRINSKCKVNITGNSKYEISKIKNTKKIFQDEISIIKKEYGKFYLFSSSFSVDCVGGTELWKKFTKKNYNINNKKNYLKFLSKEDNDYENYLFLIETAIKTAKKNPEKLIIFRPHPAQSLKLVQKRFPSNLNNLKVIYKFSNVPWIYCCEKFFHSHCSTVVDAYNLKKPIINIIANKYTRHYQTLTNFKFLKSSHFINYAPNIKNNSHDIILKILAKLFYKKKSVLILKKFDTSKRTLFNNFYSLIVNSLKKFLQITKVIFIIDYFFNLKKDFFYNIDIIQRKGELNLKQIKYFVKKIHFKNINVKKISNKIYLFEKS